MADIGKAFYSAEPITNSRTSFGEAGRSIRAQAPLGTNRPRLGLGRTELHSECAISRGIPMPRATKATNTPGSAGTSLPNGLLTMVIDSFEDDYALRTKYQQNGFVLRQILVEWDITGSRHTLLILPRADMSPSLIRWSRPSECSSPLDYEIIRYYWPQTLPTPIDSEACPRT